MLQPKKMKHAKQQRGRTRGIDRKGSQVAFGSFGLKALEAKWITARQIEAGRLSIVRTLKRKGKLWIRIFPDKPITQKGEGVGMGGGKGKVNQYVFPIKPGRIIFELDGIEETKAKEALKKAAAKFPIKTKIVSKE